jgi:hypothetical protein
MDCSQINFAYHGFAILNSLQKKLHSNIAAEVVIISKDITFPNTSHFLLPKTCPKYIDCLASEAQGEDVSGSVHL